MKIKRILLLLMVILSAGCATTTPKPSPPPVQPPVREEGITLNINLSDLEARIRSLKKLQENKELSEKDQRAVTALLDTYRLLEKTAAGPANEKAIRTLTRSLYETTSLLEKGYFQKTDKSSGEENSFTDYIQSKNEILNLYLDRNFSGVIQRCLALQTRFPGGFTPEIGMVFAYSLAEDGMPEEAVEVASEIAGTIERSPDLMQLRADIARWQLATGKRAQAVKTLEKISSIQNDRINMINDLDKQIEETPREPDQVHRSMFQAPEGTEPQTFDPQMISLQEEVDSLVRDHKFAKAKELLLKEKAIREEGPETEYIDRALKNVDEAQTAYEENMKIKLAYQKETFGTAEKLFEEEDYQGTIKTLAMLEKTQGLDAAAMDLRDRAMENLINRERNRAAEIFLEAKKNKDPKKKKELFETSYNILKKLVEDYPASPLKEKLISNMAIVQGEIEKLP
ncbi:conserved hypothetical protein [delta proteobacterium NaphS2]|nr:conserved hypothetical protein [delta proteobacterium NaphS2]